eukprot:2966354-Amphidinium_carterae.1
MSSGQLFVRLWLQALADDELVTNFILRVVELVNQDGQPSPFAEDCLRGLWYLGCSIQDLRTLCSAEQLAHAFCIGVPNTTENVVTHVFMGEELQQIRKDGRFDYIESEVLKLEVT